MKKTETILVTGCAGFIGSRFVDIFHSTYPSYRIVGIDNFSSGKRERVHSDVILCEGSVSDISFVSSIYKKYKPEAVFHFAAASDVSLSVNYPSKTTQDNILGTAVLLECARDYNVKKFIFSSSSSVYGIAKKMPIKESENIPVPISPYGLQKYTGELFCKLAYDLYGIDTFCLRYFNVYGPGKYSNSGYPSVISGWLSSLFINKKQKIFINGDGLQSRDFCFIDDVVYANISAFNSKKKGKGESFNIASGKMLSLIEIKNHIEKLLGEKLDLEKRPARIGDIKYSGADISKAKKWFGYRPKTNINDGLRETINWYMQFKNK